MYSTGALANDFVIIIIFLKHEVQSRLQEARFGHVLKVPSEITLKNWWCTAERLLELKDYSLLPFFFMNEHKLMRFYVLY